MGEAGTEPAQALKLSPLHDRHVAAGAKFAEFGGWSMPLEYAGGGVLAEHTAVRTSVGLFDVSHLGKATVTGPGAAEFLNARLTNDLSKITPGTAQYTLLCAEDGGVVDDLIAYLHGPDEVFLIPNAANTATVVDRLAEDAPAGITIANRHDDFVIIAVQGPRSDEVLAAAGLPVGHRYMSFVAAELAGPVGPVSLTVCRTGYTGERGYELVVAADRASVVWDAVVAAGVEQQIRPAGLGARDTLRTEMGYPLHGQDISPEISPVQARLGWAIGWKKPEFCGAAALRAERSAGPARLLVGLRAVGRGIPRPQMSVLDSDGAEVGVITSGTFSPTLRTGVALALVDRAALFGPQGGKDPYAEPRELSVRVRNRVERFAVTKPPFVTGTVSA